MLQLDGFGGRGFWMIDGDGRWVENLRVDDFPSLRASECLFQVDEIRREATEATARQN